MADVQYTVRTLREDEFEEALQVWRETGLQEGNHCIATWWRCDREAIWVAVAESGEVIATCSAVFHRDDFAFVGMYAVKEKFRGSGIGLKVWNACMKHIGDSNGAVNAVPDKTELYATKGGFPVRETGWSCVVNETTHTDAVIDPLVLADDLPDGVELVPFEDCHLPAIYQYDLELAGYDRSRALEGNCKEEDSKTLVALRDGACVGFGTVKRSCQDARLVGPLYADDEQVAEVMLRRLVLSMPEVRDFSMMTFTSNSAANELVRRIGCPIFEECPRLYRRQKIQIDTSKVFAQFDLNFSPF